MSRFKIYLWIPGMFLCKWVHAQNFVPFSDWTCVYISCEKVCEVCCENLVYLDFHYENGKISVYDYPYMYFGTWDLSDEPVGFCSELLQLLNAAYINPLPHSNSTYIYSVTELLYPLVSYPQLVNDTLVSAQGNRYIQTQFDTAILAELHHDSVLLSSVTGKWVLKTRYEQYYLGDSQGDGYDYIQFPFKLPATLPLKSKGSQMDCNGRYITLPSGKDIHRFKIIKIQGNKITLCSTEQVQGEYIWVEYEKTE